MAIKRKPHLTQIESALDHSYQAIETIAKRVASVGAFKSTTELVELSNSFLYVTNTAETLERLKQHQIVNGNGNSK